MKYWHQTHPELFIIGIFAMAIIIGFIHDKMNEK